VFIAVLARQEPLGPWTWSAMISLSRREKQSAPQVARPLPGGSIGHLTRPLVGPRWWPFARRAVDRFTTVRRRRGPYGGRQPGGVDFHGLKVMSSGNSSTALKTLVVRPSNSLDIRPSGHDVIWIS